MDTMAPRECPEADPEFLRRMGFVNVAAFEAWKALLERIHVLEQEVAALKSHVAGIDPTGPARIG